MKTKNFSAGVITREINAVLTELEQTLKEKGMPELAEKLVLKAAEITDRDQIRIAFVGQYSAGKSSVIRALTGDESIFIDTDVATQISRDYKWGSFLLTDTPGLQANQTHDAIAEEAITRSDLIVYTITTELFSKNTLADFKHLAFDKGYKDKIILLITRLNSEAAENTDAQIETYRRNLRKDLAPHTLEEIQHCFVDTKDYLDGIADDDAELVKESRFEEFIAFLNFFLERNGLLCRLSSSVLAAKEIIDEAFIDDTADAANRNRLTGLSRLAAHVEQLQNKASREWDGIVNGNISEFIRLGTVMVNRIGEEAFDPNAELEEAYTKTNDAISREIESFIEACGEELNAELKDVLESPAGKFVLEYIDNQLDEIWNEPEKEHLGAKGISNLAQKLGGAGLQLPKLTLDSAKKVVSTVGKKLLKIKFKPWGVTKAAKVLLKGADFLPLLGDAVGVVMDIYDAYKENKEAKKLLDARRKARQTVLETSQEMRADYNEQKTLFLKELYGDTIQAVQNVADTVNEQGASDKAFNLKLRKLRAKLDQLNVDIMVYREL